MKRAREEETNNDTAVDARVRLAEEEEEEEANQRLLPLGLTFDEWWEIAVHHCDRATRHCLALTTERMYNALRVPNYSSKLFVLDCARYGHVEFFPDILTRQGRGSICYPNSIPQDSYCNWFTTLRNGMHVLALIMRGDVLVLRTFLDTLSHDKLIHYSKHEDGYKVYGDTERRPDERSEALTVSDWLCCEWQFQKPDPKSPVALFLSTLTECFYYCKASLLYRRKSIDACECCEPDEVIDLYGTAYYSSDLDLACAPWNRDK